MSEYYTKVIKWGMTQHQIDFRSLNGRENDVLYNSVVGFENELKTCSDPIRMESLRHKIEVGKEILKDRGINSWESMLNKIQKGEFF